jgi:hypothetical protein
VDNQPVKCGKVVARLGNKQIPIGGHVHRSTSYAFQDFSNFFGGKRFLDIGACTEVE